MTSKHFNWHKSWSKDQDGNLVHQSGLKILVIVGDDYVDLESDDASLAIFRAHESARGVPAHQIDERLRRLLKEAELFFRKSK